MQPYFRMGIRTKEGEAICAYGAFAYQRDSDVWFRPGSNCGDSSHRLRDGEVIGTAEPAASEEGLCSHPGARHGITPGIPTESGPRPQEERPTVLTDENDDQVKHVKCILDSLPCDLTVEQRQKAEKFVHMHRSVFSKSEYDLGRTNLVQHRIDTVNHIPFKRGVASPCLGILTRYR